MAPTLDQNLNEYTLKLNPTHVTVECHPDIFKVEVSDGAKVAVLIVI